MQGKVLGAAALALALGASGCGSSSKPLTKAQFTQRTEAVCYRIATQAQAAQPVADVRGLLTKAIAAEQAKLAGVQKLTPPSELKADYDAYTQAIQARLNLFQKFVHGTTAQQTSSAATAQGQQRQAQEDRAAAALGLRICREDIHHHDHRTEH